MNKKYISKYFVYTGNAYPHKNLARLVEAMVLLNQNRKEKIGLKIVSARNVFVERINKLIKNNKAEGFVELLGFVDDVSIKDLYVKSLAFVFPTLSEGFGLPPKEAIDSGTYAVISDIPVLKEVYQDSVIYFNPFEIHSIKDALEEMINMPEKVRRERILKAQKFLSRYSWNKMAKETLDIYESLV